MPLRRPRMPVGHALNQPHQPVESLLRRLKQDRLTRLALAYLDRLDGTHLKDLVVEAMDDQRHMRVEGRDVINFGSDSFLGMDRDPRIQQALAAALGPWGTHNGASRAFASVALCSEAERRLARWLGVADTLIFPSVTLANVGLIPAIVAQGDLLLIDRTSHDSLHQGARIARAQGATVRELPSCREQDVVELLDREQHGGWVLAVDGVYSMTGVTPPLAALQEIVRRHGGVMYVDDAHGTGVVGPGGRGATYQALGSLDEVLMVGSLSKAFSCMGAFVTCGPELKRVLKIRSSTYIFGGPVPPPYLAAICRVCDILESPEHARLLDRLHSLVQSLTAGLRDLGLTVLGDATPIVSVVVGDIDQTFRAGKWLFDRGFYVQSATYPAVPIQGGLLRIQLNANHSDAAVSGLLEAMGQLALEFRLGRRRAETGVPGGVEWPGRA